MQNTAVSNIQTLLEVSVRAAEWMSEFCELTISHQQLLSCFVIMSGTRRSCKSNSGMIQLACSRKPVYHHHHLQANQPVLFLSRHAHDLEMRNRARQPPSNEASHPWPVCLAVLSNVPSVAVRFHGKKWTPRPWPWAASTDSA